jgi:hypothetical protein
MMSFDVVACSREVVSARPRAADGLEAAIHADAHGSIVGAGLLCEQRPDARREPLGVDQAQHVAARFPHLDAGGGDEFGQPALVVCLGRGAIQREQWCADPGQDGLGDLAQLLGRRRQQRRYARPSGRDSRAVCSRVRASVNAPEAGTRRRARSPVAGLPGRACAAAIPRQLR